MRRPKNALFVVRLHPRSLLLTGILFAGLLALLLCRPTSTEARYAPIPADLSPELRLVPPDTVSVLHVNVAALVNKDLGRGFLMLVGADESTDARSYGSPPARIDRLALLTGEGWHVAVVTTRKDYERKTVCEAVAPLSTELTHKGKKFYAEKRDPRIEIEDFQPDDRQEMAIVPESPAGTSDSRERRTRSGRR